MKLSRSKLLIKFFDLEFAVDILKLPRESTFNTLD